MSDRAVNWTALNVRLCEALKVPRIAPDCRCYEAERGCDCPPKYPGLVDSAGALLQYLRRANLGGSVGIHHDQFLGVSGDAASVHTALSDTPGHALALAAAAALGVEVPYGE